MADVKLFVLYPYPTDKEQFNRDYQEHLKLVRKTMRIPEHVQPYTVTSFVEMPQGSPAYYQMFTMSFPAVQALHEAIGSQEMQEVARDAVQISSGGVPVILVGADGA